MKVLQMWIDTGVSSCGLPDDDKKYLVNTLLNDPSISEVCYYCNFIICIDVTSEDEYELIHELKSIKSRIVTIFRSFKLLEV